MKKYVIVFGFGVAVWAFCGALIGLGNQIMSIHAALIAHAIGAPIGAVFFAWLYFRNYSYTGPAATAAIFVGAALTLDFFVVALLIENSFAMFGSIFGVWMPQALIFTATFTTGTLMKMRRSSPKR